MHAETNPKTGLEAAPASGSDRAAESESALDLAALAAHRQQFPALRGKRYFNYGGQGPMAQPVLDRIAATYQKIQEIGPFSGAANRYVAGIRDRLRDRIAQELHVSADTIALTEDVTLGCNIALWGLDWQPGDHLLLSDCEHPGIIASVQEIQRRFGLEVSVFPVMETLNWASADDVAAVIQTHLQPNTKLVVLSHILWNTGQVLPLTAIMEICRGVGVRVLVDAAQSAGVLPLALAEANVDFYAFTGHKWWGGPEGVGALYVSPEARADLHPTYIGWRGINYSTTGQPAGWKPSSERYEVATSAYPLYAGLTEAIAFQNKVGRSQQRYAQLLGQSHKLWQGLSNLPAVNCLREAPPEAGLVSFTLDSNRPNSSSSALVDALEEQGFYLRLIADPNCVRACVHYLTTDEEIEALVGAIAQLTA